MCDSRQLYLIIHSCSYVACKDAISDHEGGECPIAPHQL